MYFKPNTRTSLEYSFENIIEVPSVKQAFRGVASPQTSGASNCPGGMVPLETFCRIGPEELGGGGSGPPFLCGYGNASRQCDDLLTGWQYPSATHRSLNLGIH